MNIFSLFENHIRKSVESIDLKLESVEILSRVSAEPPRDASHGDISTNAAMVLAKPAGMKPRDLAEKLAAELEKVDGVDAINIAGPGFINISLSDAYWQGHLGEVFKSGNDFGRWLVSDGAKVNVEYVSANPTGPMHVGHCRGAVVGDALANLVGVAVALLAWQAWRWQGRRRAARQALRD